MYKSNSRLKTMSTKHTASTNVRLFLTTVLLLVWTTTTNILEQTYEKSLVLAFHGGSYRSIYLPKHSMIYISSSSTPYLLLHKDNDNMWSSNVQRRPYRTLSIKKTSSFTKSSFCSSFFYQQSSSFTLLSLNIKDEDYENDNDDMTTTTTTTTTTPSDSLSKKSNMDPQAFSSGYSTKPILMDALSEAFHMAKSGLPKEKTNIDLAMVYISSLYDSVSGSTAGPSLTSPALTVPMVLAFAEGYTVRNIIGCTVAGCISSQALQSGTGSSTSSSSCTPIEFEAIPAVSITLAMIPDTIVKTFHISAPDLPDSDQQQNPFDKTVMKTITSSATKEWKRSVGLNGIESVFDDDDANGNNINQPPPTSFFILPSPSFTAISITTLLNGLRTYFPNCQIAGGIASTVSSLSKAKLLQWTATPTTQEGGSWDISSSTSRKQRSKSQSSSGYYTDGCVGVAFQGDVQWQTLQAQGAKPVGGIYQVVKGEESSIQFIQLDQSATDALQLEENGNGTAVDDDDDDEDDDEDNLLEATGSAKKKSPTDARAAMAALYAKAQIPKPVLAEANFLMRTLSDDDQAFMRRQLLIGLEQYSGNSRIASELARLAAGEGHRFRVYPVVSAGMKDGSVTLPLISGLQIYKGQRVRFYVREPEFATQEIKALWRGYQQRKLEEQFTNDSSRSDSSRRINNQDPMKRTNKFTPSACFIIPTLDRGNKFFQGQKAGYESVTASKVLSNVQSIAGFFSNGVVGSIMDYSTVSSTSISIPKIQTGVQGSASGYFLIGSWSGRPVYSAAAAAVAIVAAAEEAKEQNNQKREDALTAEEDKALSQRKGLARLEMAAPRSDNGELILKRREVHSGRALTVSTIEWSVAEKTARPSSALEGYMWDKETEVDRFRERVPLVNLVSQCKLSLADPNSPKPRNWVGPVKQAAASSSRTTKSFVIIPECKRMDPSVGSSLRRRYDVPKLVRDFTMAGVPALSVNCDSILFGGSMEHISIARTEASSAAAVFATQSSTDGVLVPPILASDLLLYPYQLYKLRLAGADAVNMIVGALECKDLVYLTKIASSIQLQILATVTSEVQLDSLTTSLPPNGLDGVIVSNRVLEDFSFDTTGNQAIRLLQSEAMKRLREKHGPDLLVLVEGQVGIIERLDPNSGSRSGIQYIKELQDAGAVGAIIGAGFSSATNAAEVKELVEQFHIPQ